MLDYNYDDAEHTFFARLSPGGEIQEDYSEALERLGKALHSPSARGRSLAAMIILEPGHGLPDASRRAAAAKLMSSFDGNVLLAIVTHNPLFRGVLTALDWLRKKHYEDRVVARPSAAAAWLEERRGEALPSLQTRAAQAERAGRPAIGG